MLKPNNYSETQATNNGYTPVDLGGHYAVIKKVEELKSKNGNPMLKIAIDFDKKDSQALYFEKDFKNNTSADKKWNSKGIHYVTSEFNGECTKSFKSFITCFAKSNKLDPETGINWTDDAIAFGKQFAGKKIGVVYGEEEDMYNGELKTLTKIRWFCPYDDVPKQNVPKLKEYKQADEPVQYVPKNTGATANEPEADVFDIPF